MDLAGASVSGPRPYNEDAYFVRDLSDHAQDLGGLTAFIMVSDGMGGHSSGDVASRVAVETAESYIRDLITMSGGSHVEIDVAQALKEIVSEAHDAVVHEAAERGASSMGATLVAAFVSDRKAWIGHVGDSRAYLLRDGTAEQLTADHSQVGRMIAEGILTEEQAQHHPQRNVIERALGFEGVQAEVSETPLRSGDALLLCSDGVSTVLSGQDMVQLAAAARTAEDAARLLTEEALKAGTDDNATVALVSDDWALFRMSSPQRRTSRRQASKARREALRHHRASRASFVFAGIVVAVLAGIVFAAVNGTTPTGTGNGAAGGGVTSDRPPSSSATTEGASNSGQVPAQAGQVVTVKEEVPGGAWLRSRPDVRDGDAKLVELRSGARIRSVESTIPAGSGASFYVFVASEIGPAHLEEGSDLSKLAGLEYAYCWVGAFETDE